LDNNKVLFVPVTEILDKNLTGVTAIKIANNYNKPCLLLRKTEKGFEGSGRNSNGSPIEDFRNFLLDTGLFEYVQGHPNAFGVCIKTENIKPAIQKINELLSDVDYTYIHYVDFIINAEELNIPFIREMDKLKNFYGQGIEEAKIVITNICLNTNEIQLLGKESTTWRFMFNDEIEFIRFKNTEDDMILKLLNESGWESETKNIVLTVIGRANINNYGGILKPQIIIDEYEIMEE
jgi:single-stranded-DNA-specific exonuclease